MKLAVAFIFFAFIFFSAPKSASSQPVVNWITMDQALELHRSNPKKIFVYIQTSWCGWCRRMESETFAHPVIVEYLNTHFYAVKFDAEDTKPITFRGVTYSNDGAGQRRSPHGFALAILQGRLSFPSVAFFDEQLHLITSLPGFRNPARMEPLLVFINDNVFETNPSLDAFMETFSGRVGQ